MTDLHQFVLAAMFILFMPGPTNTLLAASGALLGVRQALPFVAAETLGYAVAISTLELLASLVGPRFPWLWVFLRLFCAGYLAFVAWKLWASADDVKTKCITFDRLFVATLTNPKAVVFAFIILPPAAIGILPILQVYGAILLLLIATAGASWVLLGGLVHASSFSQLPVLVRRASSVVIAAFTTLIVVGAAPTQLMAGRPAAHDRGPPATPLTRIARPSDRGSQPRGSF